ncbi:MAG: prepilin-type N-terminal cleavage/methylation domain-containing protein [Atribacterales bacterium]
MGKRGGQRFIVTSESKNRGFSLIEVVVVAAVLALAVTSLSSLFLRVNLAKSANEKLLTASTLAEDILEHIRETSIRKTTTEGFTGVDGFSNLTEWLKTKLNSGKNSLEVFFNSDYFASLTPLIYKGETLPAAINTLPEAKNLSSVIFEVKERNLINNDIEKLLVTVVIRWKEIARNPGEQEREYRLATYITKSGLREFIE